MNITLDKILTRIEEELEDDCIPFERLISQGMSVEEYYLDKIDCLKDLIKKIRKEHHLD